MLLDMYKGVANSPETTITNNINETDTIIYVLDETRIPTELPNLMVLGTGVGAETVKVLSIDSNAITVERGFQGVPKTWNAGTIIARNFTEYDYNALVENVKKIDTRVGPLTSLITRIKTSIVNALNGLQGDLDEHKADNVAHGINLKANKSQEAWLNGTLQNGWTGTLQYAKNDVGIVTVYMQMTAGTVAGITAISNLPVGYRPVASRSVVGNLRASNGSAESKGIYLTGTGDIRLAQDSNFVNGTIYEGMLIYYAG